MERFAKYLAAVNGTNDWSVIGPLFNDAFDDECVFTTAEGEFSKTQWAEMVRGLTQRSATVSGYEVTADDGDTVFYKLTVNFPDGDPMHLAAKGTLRDGRLLRVEPMDPSKYSAMVAQSR